MDRISGPGATPDNQFTEGDPAQGVPATTVTANWLNGVQEELIHILTEAGITPNEADDTQIFAAMVAIFRRKTIQIEADDINVVAFLQKSDSTPPTPMGPPIFEQIGAHYPFTMRDGVIRKRSLSVDALAKQYQARAAGPFAGPHSTETLATIAVDGPGIYLCTMSIRSVLAGGDQFAVYTSADDTPQLFQLIGTEGPVIQQAHSTSFFLKNLVTTGPVSISFYMTRSGGALIQMSQFKADIVQIKAAI